MDKTTDLSKTNSKELLVQRMLFAICSSIIMHFILMSGVILLTNFKIIHPLEWIQDTWNMVTCLRMWTYFFIFSIIVFLQGIVCSKDYMNPISYTSSRFVKFCYIFTPHNLLVGSLYTLLGGIVALLHLSVQGGRFGSLTKNCEKLQGYCLVEEHFFLLLEGFWIGLYFFLNSSYTGISNVQFTIIPQSKISQVKRGLQSIIANILIDSIYPMAYFLGFYSVFGSYFRNFVSSPFSLLIEEVPLDKISRILSLSLIFYAWLHAVLFALTIQSMHLLFQAYLTEWIPFNINKIHFTERSKVSLADALTMEKMPILQHLGYLDLITIAQKDKARRSLLFTLSQPGGHPYNWNSVIEKSLLLIKKFSEEINSASSSRKQQVHPSNKPASVINFETLEKPYVYHMRNLVSPVTTGCSSINEEESKSESVDNFIVQYCKNMRKSIINYLLSKRLISYIFAEQFENKLRYVLYNAQAVIWATDAIASLAVVSLNEDQYGIVQKDLSDIIEAILKLKQSLDKLQKLNISIRKPMSDDKFLKQTLTALRSTVRRSLYKIVSHFKNYLDDLALSPLTVDQLQPFLSYKE